MTARGVPAAPASPPRVPEDDYGTFREKFQPLDTPPQPAPRAQERCDFGTSEGTVTFHAVLQCQTTSEER